MLRIDIINDDAAENFGVDAIMDEHFHAVMALNKTAQKASDEIKADMPGKFTLRNKWVQKGIRLNKGRTDNLTARIYSVDPYMYKQEAGEKYKPDGHVAIPWGARPSKKSLIPRSMLPKALRGRNDVFRFDFSGKASYKPFPLSGIFQRVMGGKHLRVLYLLKDEKTTAPRWEFTSQVEETFDRYFDQYYDELDIYDYDEIVTDFPRWPR
jgi:hypothetical protein